MLTESLCPTCYRVIPADITLGEHVYIIKECPIHGFSFALIEPSVRWWEFCQTIPSKDVGFYQGYIVDITAVCNLHCKWCFHGKTPTRKVDDILTDISEAGKKPIYFTGGEPTTYSDLPDLILETTAYSPVWIVTNGVRLADPNYLDLLCKVGLLDGNDLHVALSFHGKANIKQTNAVLERCRKEGWTIETGHWVIDSLEQIDEAIETMTRWKDVIRSMKIKSVANVWATQTVTQKIYTSQMMDYFFTKPNTKYREDQTSNRVGMANIEHEGMLFTVASWYDRWNIDLNNCRVPPWMRTHDGKLVNFEVACILNEAQGGRV